MIPMHRHVQNLCADASMPGYIHPCLKLTNDQGGTVEVEDCVLENMEGTGIVEVRQVPCLRAPHALPYSHLDVVLLYLNMPCRLKEARPA
jgi:hypothetical protein